MRCCGLVGVPVTVVVILVEEGMMDWVPCQLRSEETDEAT